MRRSLAYRALVQPVAPLALNRCPATPVTLAALVRTPPGIPGYVPRLIGTPTSTTRRLVTSLRARRTSDDHSSGLAMQSARSHQLNSAWRWYFRPQTTSAFQVEAAKGPPAVSVKCQVSSDDTAD